MEDFFRTTVIGVRTIAIGREIQLNSEDNKDSWGFIAKDKVVCWGKRCVENY